MKDWIDRIYGTKVEKHLVSGGVAGGMDRDPSFCIHTTEGSTLDGALGTIDGTGYAPHFTVGEDRIVQQRALSTTGSALRSHNDHFVQVECVGFSKENVHELTLPTWRPLVLLSRWVHTELHIPLYRPWGDQLPPGSASNNPRRRQGYALTRRGFYGHVDVPDQAPTWHWDPGSLAYKALFKQIRDGGDDMTEEQLQRLKDTEAWQAGYEAYAIEGKTTPGKDWSNAKLRGFRAARRVATGGAGP